VIHYYRQRHDSSGSSEHAVTGRDILNDLIRTNTFNGTIDGPERVFSELAAIVAALAERSGLNLLDVLNERRLSGGYRAERDPEDNGVSMD
jgi:hypothetical protein